MEVLKEIISEYYLWVIIFGLFSFIAFILLLISTNKKRKRFLVWKKEVIDLWVYRSEKEFGKDEILEQLYDENVRLGKENKLLRQQASDASFSTIMILFTVIFAMWFRRKTKDRNEDTINQEVCLKDNMPIKYDEPNE